jgi:hypothetical protein
LSGIPIWLGLGSIRFVEKGTGLYRRGRLGAFKRKEAGTSSDLKNWSGFLLGRWGMDLNKIANRIAGDLIPLFTEDRPNTPPKGDIEEEMDVIPFRPSLPKNTLVRYDTDDFAIVPTRDLIRGDLSDGRIKYLMGDSLMNEFASSKWFDQKILLYDPDTSNSNNPGQTMKAGDMTYLQLESLPIIEGFESLGF